MKSCDDGKINVCAATFFNPMDPPISTLLALGHCGPDGGGGEEGMVESCPERLNDIKGGWQLA